jgi:L-iditol 2-dehydrogenase
MKALRYYGPGKVEIEDLEPPTPQPGEVLVRVRACGVCATDIKTVRRGHPKIKPGSVIGHEVSGTIVSVNQVEGWKPGDRIAAAPYTPCGECDACKRGQFTLCDHLMDEGFNPGGFAEYITIPQRIVQKGMFVVPEGLSYEHAALAEPLGCCLHGLEAVDITPRDRLLILGDGPMGLLQAEAARALGVRQIILTGMIPARLERAAQVVDVVIDASHENVAERIQQIYPGGADKVMVSVGDATLAETAFSYVRKGGTINLFAGLPRGVKLSIDPYQIHYDEVRLVGSFGLAPQHFQQALNLLATGMVNVAGIITATVPIQEVIEAIQNVAEFRGIKTVVKFGEEEELPIN